MQKKFFKPIAIGNATALIAVASLLSYVIGLFRDRIIAIHFGTSSATDTYNASFLIPDMIFNLFIAGALAAAFLPIFSDYLIKDKKEAYKIANTMLTGAVILISLLAILAFIFMANIIPFAFPGTDISMQQDIINMTRLMLGSAVLFAISNTLGNILMSYKHFISYAISPILYNLGIILGVIFLKDSLGIYSAAVGVLIGATLHCIIRVIDTFSTEYKFKFDVNFRHPGFKKIIKLMIPRSLSLIAWQINLYIFAIVGLSIQTGGLAAFNFARNIQSFPVSLFGISFATAVFPYITEAISKNDKKTYTEHIQKTIQRILFFSIPAAAGIMILAKPLVELILGGGLFDEESVRLTTIILAFFALSIPFESITHILSRSFYALHNTITPTIINILGMIIIGMITYYIAPIYGIEWFSIGFSIGMAFYMIVMIFFLKKHLQNFNSKQFIISLSKTIVATGIMIIALLISDSLGSIISLKFAHIIRILLGATIFFLTAIALKSEETGSIKYILDRLLKKNLNESKT